MHHQVICIFDDYVTVGTSPNNTTVCDSLLGRADQLALQAIVDDVTVAGSFDLFVESSGDDRNWIQRNGNATTAGNGDISLASIAVGNIYSSMWSDGALQLGAVTNAKGPLLPYQRVRIQLGTGAAHVVVHAVFRDLG